MFTVACLLVMGITISIPANEKNAENTVKKFFPNGIANTLAKEIMIPQEAYGYDDVNPSNQENAGKWFQMPEAPLEGRFMYSSILSDKKLIIWGGRTKDRIYNDGAIYDIEKNEWRKMANSPIEARAYHVMLLSKSKVVIWGGESSKEMCNDGAIYEMDKNTWQKISNAPMEGRYFGTAVLSGTKLLVWGGRSFGNRFGSQRKIDIYDDGAIYDIEKNSWRKISKAPIDARTGHNSIVSKTKLIIWGGQGSKGKYNDGALYDMEKDTWQKMAESSVDISGEGVISISTATKLIVCGGEPFKIRAIYNVEKDKWEEIRELEIPIEVREDYTSIVSGTKLIIWGGCFGPESKPTMYNDGAIFDTEKGTWKKIPEAPIKGRKNNINISSGTKLIVWGGHYGDSSNPTCYGDGAVYDINNNTWQVLPDAPIKARAEWRTQGEGPIAVLSGTKIIIWGGAFNARKNDAVFYKDGAIYDMGK
jgi:N-acetylneuraminic acid mutarotase